MYLWVLWPPSGKLTELKGGSFGKLQSTIWWSEAQMTTWNCDWHLNCVWGCQSHGIEPLTYGIWCYLRVDSDKIKLLGGVWNSRPATHTHPNESELDVETFLIPRRISGHCVFLSDSWRDDRRRGKAHNIYWSPKTMFFNFLSTILSEKYIVVLLYPRFQSPMVKYFILLGHESSLCPAYSHGLWSLNSHLSY